MADLKVNIGGLLLKNPVMHRERLATAKNLPISSIYLGWEESL